MSSHEPIRAVLILDMIGKPAEHLLETLEKLIGEMKIENGVKVISTEIKEPTLLKDTKDFYTTFAEIEVEVEELAYIAMLMFKYMPAHIEVISPEEITASNNVWGEVLSEIIRRLHSYDEVARVMQLKYHKLLKKVKELEGEDESENEEEPELSEKE